MKTHYFNKFAGLAIAFIVYCIAPKFTNAATYYVSPNGTAAWANATNIATPCTTQAAFNNALEGDTVYFREGIYTVPPKNSGNWLTGYYQMQHSGTIDNPIVFMAYPGEVPLFDGTEGGSGDKDGHDYYGYATIFGNNKKEYITIDGFSFQANGGTAQARLVLQTGDNGYTGPKAKGIVLKNCTFNGGLLDVNSGDIRGAIFISQIEELTISNCIFYDYIHSNNNLNTAAIMVYFGEKLTIENCEFYNNVQSIYWKTAVNNSIIRNNYIHDGYVGIHQRAYVGSRRFDSRNNKIYNNVLVNNSYLGLAVSAEGEADNDSTEIYNNTIYGKDARIEYGVGYTKIYNNIIQATTIPGPFQAQLAHYRTPLELIESDHNQFGSGTLRFAIYLNIPGFYTLYSSLAEWQGSGNLMDGSNPDEFSIASDPQFENANGDYIDLDDFRLATGSPCIGTGRNGDDMGANIDWVGINGTPPIPTAMANPVHAIKFNPSEALNISNSFKQNAVLFSIAQEYQNNFMLQVYSVTGQKLWQYNSNNKMKNSNILWKQNESKLSSGNYIAVLNSKDMQIANKFPFMR